MTIALWASPLGTEIERLQDAGRNVWVWGWSADGLRALVVDSDNARASIASRNAVGSLGRWECSSAHLRDHTALYAATFSQR